MMPSIHTTRALVVLLVLGGLLSSCSTIFPFEQQLPDAAGDADADGDSDSDGDADGDSDADEEGVDPECDEDGDGHASDSEDCAGDDCDDGNRDVHPGVFDVCNGRDDNCNELTDEVENLNASNLAYESVDVSIAWGDNEIGLAWTDNSGSSGGNEYRGEIYFVRLRRFGEPIGTPIQVTATGENAYKPQLVWTGVFYGLVFVRSTGVATSDVYYLNLGRDGVTRGEPVALTHEVERFATLPAVVWTGTGFGLAWQSQLVVLASIWLLAFDSSGVVTVAPVQVSDSTVVESGWRPSLAWTGDEFGVSWTDYRDGATHQDIYFARVSSGGEVLSERPMTATPRGVVADTSALAWSGAQYGLTYIQQTSSRGQNKVYLATISPTGVAAAPVEISGDIPTETQPNPAISWGDGAFGIAWRQGDEGSGVIMFSRYLVTEGVRSTPRPVSIDRFETGLPAVTWASDAFAVAWQDYRVSGEADIFLAPSVCIR